MNIINTMSPDASNKSLIKTIVHCVFKKRKSYLASKYYQLIKYTN